MWSLHICRNVNSIERAHVRNVDYNLKREHILVRLLILYVNILKVLQAKKITVRHSEETKLLYTLPCTFMGRNKEVIVSFLT